ncbi:hypothetical protein KAU11_09250 [Candidatus Babeliales bacterium]|nr:hypothetical protein [Candidatus Babeliales bacterium]
MAQNQEVNLTAKDAKGKSKSRKFGIQHANNILSISNTQWKLDDPKWKWNGTELAKA